MRILMVGTELAPVRAGAGGLEHLLVGWARQLADRHEVIVWSPADCGDGAVVTEGHEQFSRIAGGDPQDLAGVLSGLDADVVLINNRPQWATNLPAVVAIHNSVPAWFESNPPAGRSIDLIQCARDAPIVFAVSEFLRSDMESTLGRKVEVVNPFVGEEFVPSGGRRSDSVLFVGRLLRKKGIEFLCDVAQDLPTVDFEITDFISPWTSPTEEHQALRALVRMQDNCALVPSPPTRSALARLMASVGVVFVPSQWEEPFGLVSIEAQAVGTRVVVTARGGLPETVVDPGSFVVAPDAPGEAAAALVKALTCGPPDPQVSREVHARFSLAQSTASLERLLIQAAR